MLGRNLILVALIIGITLAIAVVTNVVRTLILASHGRTLAQQARPFEQAGASTGAGANLRILVAGDSTAVGTGVLDPATSVAGLIGARYPGATVVNRSKNGLEVHEIAALLPAPPERFDVVVLLACGNNILHRTPLDKLPADVNDLLDRARKLSDHVVLMPPGMFATAPIFPWPVNAFFGQRSRQVRDIARAAAKSHQVAYVDLLRPADKDPFAQDPKRYYSADGFHPGVAGYADWFTQLLPTLERLVAAAAGRR
ncbi:MAG: GDSL-type esterase/lipase family protein [Candidatus Andersenbacteria bacterium]